MLETFPWSKLITMVFSASALILSGWGLYFAFTANSLSKQSNDLSNEANRTSNKAFELSAKSFEIETRPFLNIDFQKQEEGLYYIIKSDGVRVLYCFTVRMTNVGKTPASNISIPQTANLQDIKSINENLNVVFPSDLVLGPGQSYEIDFKMGGIPTTKSIEEEIQERSARAVPIDFTFSVNYQNFAAPEKKYRSKIKYRITPTMVSYLEGGEML